jgi:hypothetical protein
MNCFISYLDQCCWNVINMLLQGHNWDKDIKEDTRVEWIFLALDNRLYTCNQYFSFTKG